LEKEGVFVMASKNVEALRAMHESWNRRDFDATMRHVADNVTFTDHPRNLKANSKNEYRTILEGWAKAFSDGRITSPQYLDAGDTVIVEFTGVGTNDGPLGDLPATGRKVSMALCEILRFDKNNKIVSGTAYYDMYGMLQQLGHVQPRAAAA
jgi:steroid delta-isomerase-like uncharacterized protein